MRFCFLSLPQNRKVRKFVKARFIRKFSKKSFSYLHNLVIFKVIYGNPASLVVNLHRNIR